VPQHLAFLIDENLSPSLAEMAQERGFRAMHATWAELSGRKDHQVASYAAKSNMILVTNDLSDFRRIYKRKKLHPGIIFLGVVERDQMDREAQRHMFEQALDQAESDEPINEAIYVQLDEDEEENWVLTTTRYTLAKPQ
jgi:predicted nuclease of predicted toxin-antitoxin system